jgi:hypothetical protein
MAAPYVKNAVVGSMMSVRNPGVAVELVTSFKLENYHRQASDLGALEAILAADGRVFNFQRLHAKLYIFDEETAVVTSGNLTSRGLGENFEYGVLVEERDAVREVCADFRALKTNPDAGVVKTAHLDKAREILAKVPKPPAIHLPNIETPGIEADQDVFKGGENAIAASLTGWKLAVFECLKQVPERDFSLTTVTAFSPDLKTKFPQNNNVEAKIRQQLQALRDVSLVEFKGGGRYKKLW